MSDTGNSPLANFGKFVPGFDFLQNLATQAADSAGQKTPQMPNLGSWVAPTLNVEELDKRIQELKAVQFWLDQNATALKATIQALEVQKMTLATLKGMNFNMGDVANAFQLKAAESPPTKPPVKAKPAKATAPVAAGVVDPMQWWGALTQQFQNIATEAVKDAAKKAAINTTTKNTALRSSQAWPSPVAAKKPAAKKTAVKATRKTNR